MITRIGDLDHLESGQVILHNDKAITIVIEGLTFEFTFSDDITIDGTTVVAKGDGKKLSMNFVNYRSGLGTVNANPLPVGTVNKKQLFLNYAIYDFRKDEKSSVKLFHYTFLLGG